MYKRQVYTQDIKKTEEFLILVKQSEHITHDESTQHNYRQHNNHNYNHNHYNDYYSTPKQHWSAVNIGHTWTNKECSRQERRSSERQRGKSVWPTPRKKFSPYDHTSYTVKANVGTKRDEAEIAVQSATQWQETIQTSCQLTRCIV